MRVRTFTLSINQTISICLCLISLQILAGCNELSAVSKQNSSPELLTKLGTNLSSKFQTNVSGEALSIDANNVYSPNLIIQGSTMFMYFGGWYNQGQTHDNIYRAECPTLGTCQPAALLLDASALGFEHLNDPSVLQLPSGSYLMYMTGVYRGEDGLSLAGNHIFVSQSDDAINWSAPSEIAHDMWLPSATLGPDNRVYLYGNCATCGEAIVRYDLGFNGLSPSSRAVVQLPRFYSNVEVRYIPSINSYQIVGETNLNGQDQIDFLSSSDGLQWTLQADGLIKPHAGQLHVGTPAFYPNNGLFVYYREASDPGNTQNKIWGMQWSVSGENPPPAVESRSPASTIDYTSTVNALYQRFLNRSADPGGLALYSVELNGGIITVDQLSHILATSFEAGFVLRQMAIDILGRSPDSISIQDAINGWAGYLESYSMEQTRLMFVSSEEGQNHSRELARQLALSATEVIGVVDGVQDSTDGHFFITGWACDRNTADQIRVDFYVGGPAGSGRGVTSSIANLSSEIAVAQACNDATGAAHRFQIPIPDDIMNAYAGQGIFIHGISNQGGANNLLSQSGAVTIPQRAPQGFDLLAIGKSGTGTGTGQTELHILSGASLFSQYTRHTATSLGQTGNNWTFRYADVDRDHLPDLVGIEKYGTQSGRVEVHVLSGASNFTTYIKHTATALAQTNGDQAQFELVDWDQDGIPDLAMILKSGTGSGKTEVHILSGASDYQTFIAHIATGLNPVENHVSFRFADVDHDGHPDLIVVIPFNTGSGKVEVHALSFASGLKDFILHSATAQPAMDAATLDVRNVSFQVGDWNRDGVIDLIMVLGSATGTHSTEVHVMSGATDFSSFILQTGTALGESGRNFETLIVPR